MIPSESVRTIERLSSGIKELDVLIDGGYPKSRSVLITGGPGVGKTIIALQFINDACANGLKCIYLATEETPEELKIQAAQLGLSISEYEKNGLLTFEPVLAERMDDVTWQRGKNTGTSLFKKPLNSIKSSDADIVVLDNIGSYTLDTTIGTFREQMDYLVNTIRERKMTGLIISDEALNERYNNVAQYSVHGAIHMFKRESPFTGNVERLMNVVKMRGTNTPLSYVRYSINQNGINVQNQKESK
ncbi:MAG: RAD55 family ATPase [Thermoplasmata archaeon]|nr:RAD55 family ATPase [Thermoplasmata archaeon]